MTISLLLFNLFSERRVETKNEIGKIYIKIHGNINTNKKKKSLILIPFSMTKFKKLIARLNQIKTTKIRVILSQFKKDVLKIYDL